MGRHFLECLGGKVVFLCAKCKTFFTNLENLNSDKFRGNIILVIKMLFIAATGAAYLFNNVTNIEKLMTTGKHIVRDVSCKNCKCKVGWMYEFAFEDTQRYKEGKVILEKSLIEKRHGIDDVVIPIPSSSINVPSNSSTSTITLAAHFSRNSSTSSFSSSFNSTSSPDENSNDLQIGSRIYRGIRY